MRLSVKRKPFSGAFLELLKQRRQQFASIKMAAQITVTPELAWWYWQEFGTAIRGDAGRASGRTYDNPTGPTGFAFPDAIIPNAPGGYRVGEQLLNQPGIYGKHFVEQSIPSIMKFAGRNLMEAGHESGYNPVVMRTDLLTNTMPTAINIIANTIAGALPGTRTDGKLHGDSAAGVFEREAKVRNVGS